MSEAAIALVAAVARNGVIGGANAMIWRLPTDMKHFRALTLGKPLVMGRKTFQAIGKPLPGRETIVVTRDGAFAAPGAHIAPSLEAALALARQYAQAAGQDEIVIGGGGEIYAQAIGLADRLHLTEVDLAPPGDAFFPPIDPAVWRETRRERPERGERDEADFAFVDYARSAPAPQTGSR